MSSSRESEESKKQSLLLEEKVALWRWWRLDVRGLALSYSRDLERSSGEKRLALREDGSMERIAVAGPEIVFHLKLNRNDTVVTGLFLLAAAMTTRGACGGGFSAGILPEKKGLFAETEAQGQFLRTYQNGEEGNQNEG